MLFRTVRLNWAGRLALIGVCLIAAGLGLLFAAPYGWAVGLVGAVLLAVCVLALCVVLDRRRWRAGWVGYSWTDDEAAKQTVCDALVAQGIECSIDVWDGHGSLRFRNRDTVAVNRELVARGAPAFRRL